MTVRHPSIARPVLLAVVATAYILVIGDLGSIPVACGDEAAEPAAVTKTDDAEAPEVVPGGESSEAASDSKPADEATTAASDNSQPAPTPTADAKPDEDPTPAQDASKTEEEETPEKSSEDTKEETPPPPAPVEAADEKPKEDTPPAEKPAAMPPKPAEADVLESVISPAAADAPQAMPEKEAAANPPVEKPAALPVEEKPTAEPTADQKVADAPPSEEPAAKMELPPDVEAAMDDFMEKEAPPKTLQFVFRYQPWEKVIQWFADEAGLSLIMDSPPPGTFNYTDNRSYTPAEAIDLLNGVLLTKGYTLIRRDRMLMVINLEDGIPPELVTAVPLDELDNRGEFELIAVLFQLDKFDPQEAAKEIEKLIGPQGSVVVLPKTKQLYVTETGGRLRTIRDVIQRVEDPQGLLSGKLQSYEFKNILPDEGVLVLRQLLNIPTDANASEDDSFRFAMDPVGMRLLFSGTPEKISKAKEILEAIDVTTGDGEKSTALESLQLEVYPIAVADPESVLKVMQTLLEGLPGVRLSIDPKTGSLVALARPSDHATIRATIDQMQAEVRRIEVIYLQRVDPQLAAVAIKKMFGDAGDDKEKNSTAPTVEADSAGRQLIVHGTENQISQIRVLLGKMGETEFADGPVATGNRIRVLPITGHRAEAALENLRMIWPMISDNPIKEVTPSAMIPSLKPQETIPARVPAKDEDEAQGRKERRPFPPSGIPGLHGPIEREQPPVRPDHPTSESDADRQTRHLPSGGPFRFAAQTEESEPEVPAADSPSDQLKGESEKPPAPKEEAANETPKAKSPIVISRGPNGLMIASDDTAALDEFERQLNMLTGGTDSDRTELNIFYLKHAKAAVVAETLTKIIGSGTTGASTASEDSILGQLVGGALGSTVGSLMSLGSATLSPTGMLRITPEPRLNALIVEANATDLHTIEEVLKLLDLPESPEEILVNPRARLIPVYNMAADEAAEIVKEIFADRMQGASGRNSGGGEQRPSPADFFAAMRGGRGGAPGGQRGSTTNAAPKEEPEKMTVGVDSRSNSVIVFASQSLYEEVRVLVEELDSIAGAADDEAMQVVTLKGLNPEAMKAALIAIMGEDAVSSSTSSSSNRSSNASRSGSSRSGSSGQPSRGMSDDMRRRFEMMRGMMGRGGAPGGFGGNRGGQSGAPSGGRGGR